MESPFDVLPVDPDASEEEIHEAYRERVLETHPDQGGSIEDFQRVRAAYEALLSSVDPTEATDTGTTVDDRSGPTEPVVEYLDYETLADYGWSLDDGDLFEKAADADLDDSAYGRVRVDPDEHLLESVEQCGCTWPYSCRGGACANCAVAVVEGDLSMPASHVLPPEMTDRGIQLSCVGTPTTEELKVVYNVKHLPELDELRLPPGPFERAKSDD